LDLLNDDDDEGRGLVVKSNQSALKKGKTISDEKDHKE
jgi:hypothetical protein